MKSKPKHLFIVFLFCIATGVFSQDYHVRIGFIGNSITIGTFLTDPERECYPSQLRTMLQEKYGDTLIIKNYAVSGRTMLKKGDNPIWNENSFKECMNYAPDICFIALGTNDTKPYNWDDYGNEFYIDYISMIDTFKKRNPRTKFIVCRPAPAFGVVYDIRNEIIVKNIIPLVDSISKVTGAELVDFYTGMLDSAALFPDKIHPDKRGAKAMAKIAFDKIEQSGIIHKVEKGYTFVTGLKSSIVSDLRMKDTALISWSTINATEAYLNGIEVELNGSVKVAPLTNTKYTLKAKGNNGEDSLIFEQKVYAPEVTKVYSFLSKTASSIFVGDTIEISLKYYDQKSKAMNDTVIDVSWAVTEGSGRLINKGDNKIQFIADSIGKVKISETIGNQTFSTSLTVKNISTNVSSEKKDVITAYPNPTSDELHFSIPESGRSKIRLQISDMTGRVVYNDKKVVNSVFSVNTRHLPKGMYMYNLEINGKKYSGKFQK